MRNIKIVKNTICRANTILNNKLSKKKTFKDLQQGKHCISRRSDGLKVLPFLTNC